MDSTPQVNDRRQEGRPLAANQHAGRSSTTDTKDLKKKKEGLIKGKKAFSEFCGTFFFVLTIGLSSAYAGKFAPIAIGYMLMAQVFCFGYISGGHFNPAVTLGTMLIGQLPIMRGVCYIVAQVLACVLAALIAWALLDNFDEFQPPTPNESSLGNLEVARAFFAEMIFTGALVSVVLHVACSRQRDNQHYGLAIGVTLVAIIYAAGEISGGSFNPAVATALHLQKCFSGDCWAFRYIWIYWVAPALGACLAAFIFGINQKLEEEESGVYIREREKKTGRPPKGASAQKSDGDVDATDPKANDLVE